MSDFKVVMIDDDKDKNSQAVVNDAVMPNYRVRISRLENLNRWDVITNAKWGIDERAMNMLLLNFANNYVEYRNCGVCHRMIRVMDARDYGIKTEDIKVEHCLVPTDEHILLLG